jgi:hypothetical protein
MLLQQVYLSWLRYRLRRFLHQTRRARDIQHAALLQKISRNASSDFGRAFGFNSIRTAAEFRQRVPVLTYEDHHPYLTRVLHGDTTALFAPGTRVLMFAMTSGTTGEPKRLPITEQMFREYRAGWLIWGAGVYGDHRHLMFKKMQEDAAANERLAIDSHAWRRSMRADQRFGGNHAAAHCAAHVPAATRRDENPRFRGQALHGPAPGARVAGYRHDHHGQSQHAGRVCPPC